MIVIKPPDPLPDIMAKPAVFLAGSIEQGSARDWQVEITEVLKGEDIYVLNPRRESWNASLEQSIDNLVFRGQVEWELSAMERSSVILMHFEPETKSPITLLELGLWARLAGAEADDRLVVHCPDGFWRKGNVDVVCSFYGVQQAQSIEEMTALARVRLALARARINDILEA